MKMTDQPVEKLTIQHLARLRRRAHVHEDRCFGRYEPCGEHHVHDGTCGSRPLICRTLEDADLRVLLAEYDRLREAASGLKIVASGFDTLVSMHTMALDEVLTKFKETAAPYLRMAESALEKVDL
jgi:hypothetical protein